MGAASSGLGISYHSVPQFSISRVWRDGWEIFRESPILFVSIVVAGNLPGGWSGGWLMQKIPMGLSLPVRLLLIGVVGLFLFFLLAIAQGLINLIVFRRYNKQPNAFRADWRCAMSRAMPLLLTMLCLMLLGLIGLIALIVPALIILTVCASAMAVCAVEGKGPAASLVRSADLTRGHRWAIFGLLMEFVIPCILLEALTAGVWSGVCGFSQKSLLLSLVQFLVTLLPSAYFTVTWAVMYCHLRELESANPIMAAKASQM